MNNIFRIYAYYFNDFTHSNACDEYKMQTNCVCRTSVLLLNTDIADIIKVIFIKRYRAVCFDYLKSSKITAITVCVYVRARMCFISAVLLFLPTMWILRTDRTTPRHNYYYACKNVFTFFPLFWVYRSSPKTKRKKTHLNGYMLVYTACAWERISLSHIRYLDALRNTQK